MNTNASHLTPPGAASPSPPQARRWRSVAAEVVALARPDVEACLFAAKCLLAALLALYFTFRLGLTRPFWAIGTVFLVSQPFSGASMSRGLFRLLGTAVGGAATVVLVPTFANEPMVLSIALASWIGFCLYLALLDRTPRSYAFLLAGYTTSLIGYPAVAVPAEVFTIAATRLQEIMIGVTCASLVHALIFPRTVTARLQARVSAIIADAERWTLDMIGQARPAVVALDRARAAAALLELHQMATHLPFDASRGAARTEILRTLHDRLSSLLVHSSALEDSLIELRRTRSALPAPLTTALMDMRRWLSGPGADDGDPVEQGPQRPAPRTAAPGDDWDALAVQTAIDDLAELASAHRDCRLLHSRLQTAHAGWATDLPERLQRARGHVLHRDHWLAARSALGLVAGLSLGCLLWIQTGWTHGATAVSVMGALCALAGLGETPAGSVWRYLAGSVLGIAIGLFYGFVVLPRTTDFPVLAAVLAPTLLLFGGLLARPQHAFLSLGVLLGFPIIAGLGTTNASHFLTAINDSVALIVGIAMTLVSVSVFQTIAVDHSRGRLVRAIARDAARLANGRIRDVEACRSQMLDRIGLLAARLAGHPAGQHLLRIAMADMRSGELAAQLRDRARYPAPAELAARLDTVVAAVATDCGPPRAADVPRGTATLAALELARPAAATAAPACRGRLLAGLSQLRRDALARSLDQKE